eukprot:TRINITY_DN930_c1_g1_i1.p1 TRINITY_DN930_c1_g1~~TRINITY_DN930_c1_g1_i1.p1  ORF type:complete len:511 (-),score=157.48 TRINITY_DN930_c1_g1_i1:52-1584(-)
MQQQQQQQQQHQLPPPSMPAPAPLPPSFKAPVPPASAPAKATLTALLLPAAPSAAAAGAASSSSSSSSGPPLCASLADDLQQAVVGLEEGGTLGGRLHSFLLQTAAETGDCALRDRAGATLLVHRCVIAAQSPVLRTLLYSEPPGITPLERVAACQGIRTVDLDCDSNTLGLLVEYLYSGHCSLTLSDCFELLAIAKRYDVPSMYAAISAALPGAIQPPEACLALLRRLRTLQGGPYALAVDCCLRRIVEDGARVLAAACVRQRDALATLTTEDVAAVMACTELCQGGGRATEGQLLRFVLCWLDAAQAPVPPSCVFDLLGAIDLATVDPHELGACYKRLTAYMEPEALLGVMAYHLDDYDNAAPQRAWHLAAFAIGDYAHADRHAGYALVDDVAELSELAEQIDREWRLLGGHLPLLGEFEASASGVAARSGVLTQGGLVLCVESGTVHMAQGGRHLGLLCRVALVDPQQRTDDSAAQAPCWASSAWAANEDAVVVHQDRPGLFRRIIV